MALWPSDMRIKNAAICGAFSGLHRRKEPFISPSCLEFRGFSGPFVYRLGREVFNLERGVRFP